VRPAPGLVFSLRFDDQFGVAIITHDLPRIGSLIWPAERTFASEPTLADAEQIDNWRWPVLFPLTAAIRLKIVSPIGTIAVPALLRSFPRMRSGGRGNWVACDEQDGSLRPLGPTSDRSLPIYQVVNDTRLKEMLLTDWRPDQVW
jgi:hypothetical protein